MKIEAKPRTLVAAVLVIVILVGGYFYMNKTAPKRAYVRQLKDMRLIHERQQLDIEIYEQQKRLAAIKAEKEAAIPTYELTPAQKAEKTKVIEGLNQ